MSLSTPRGVAETHVDGPQRRGRRCFGLSWLFLILAVLFWKGFQRLRSPFSPR